MYCPRCGERNDEGNRFCTGCGGELATPPAAGEDSRASEPEPAGEAEPAGSGGPGRSAFLRRVIGTSRRERIVTGATVGAIVLAVIAFLLLDTPQDDSGSDPFLSASDQRCVEAKQEISRAGKALATGKADTRAEYADALLAVVLRWRADQRSLQPAPDQQAAADAYLAALLDVGAGIAGLSEAARDGGEKQIAAAAESADASTAALEAEIDDLGLEQCGSLAFAQPPSG